MRSDNDINSKAHNETNADITSLILAYKELNPDREAMTALWRMSQEQSIIENRELFLSRHLHEAAEKELKSGHVPMVSSEMQLEFQELLKLAGIEPDEAK